MQLFSYLSKFMIFIFSFSIKVIWCDVKKCCPLNSGLLLSEKNSYSCVNPEELGRENVSEVLLLNGHISNIEYGFPEYCVDGYSICFDKVLLYQTNDTANDKSSEIISINCNGTLEKATFDAVGVLPKCCPKGLSYSLEIKSCVFENQNSHLSAIYSSDIDFIDYKYGWTSNKSKTCRTYRSSKHKISIQNKRLFITDKRAGPVTIIEYGDFCVDNAGNEVIAIGCQGASACLDDTCVSKCCPVGQHYEPVICGKQRQRCVPGHLPFKPQFYEINDWHFTKTKSPEDYTINILLKCERGRFWENTTPVYLTTNGDLYRKPLQPEKYCLETSDSRRCGGEVSVETYICIGAPPVVTKVKDTIMFVALCISLFCLSLTLGVYCLMPSLRNVHGMSRMCHVIALFAAFLLLVRVRSSTIQNKAMCVAFGYGIYFSFLSAFLWLNIMCFDMWWTFGSIQNQTIQRPSAARRRFIYYSGYAWGIAIAFTIVVGLLDVYPVSPYLDAEIGKNYCWFGADPNSKNDWPHYILFLIPVAILISINLILWILTIRHCAKVKSDLHRIQFNDIEKNKAKNRFFKDRAKYMLTLRMLIVMGVSWVCEVISTFFTEPKWLWFLTDLINELQGFSIFIILIMRPRVLQKLQKKLGIGNCVRLETEGSGVRSSSASRSYTTTWLTKSVNNDEKIHLRINNEKNGICGYVGCCKVVAPNNYTKHSSTRD